MGTIELELKLMMIETLIYFYKPFVGMRLKLGLKLIMIKTLMWIQLKLKLKLMMIETLMWMNRWAK